MFEMFENMSVCVSLKFKMIFCFYLWTHLPFECSVDVSLHMYADAEMYT
jgi:hypothetical protein